MLPRRNSLAATLCASALLGSMTLPMYANACTRVVYLGANDDVITGRSMDWKSDIATNLWIFPRGMERSGEAGPNSVKWVSKYGSVIASAYDISTSDDLNKPAWPPHILYLLLPHTPHSHHTHT